MSDPVKDPAYLEQRERARDQGSTMGLYTPELRAWAKRVHDTFEERWHRTAEGWVRK